MTSEQDLHLIDKFLELISDMSFSFAIGTGLQASGLAVLLLAVVAVFFHPQQAFQ